MGIISPTLPTIGDDRGTEEVDVRNALSALLALVNGNLEAANVLDASLGDAEFPADALTARVLADAALLGLTEPGVVRRGTFAQAAEGTRTNTAFGALSNGPDEVQSVVVPANGRMLIDFRAQMKESVVDRARCAVFLGANQLKVIHAGQVNPVVQGACLAAGVANAYQPVITTPAGLIGIDTGYGGDVTTGQAVGAFLDDASYGAVTLAAARQAVQIQATAGTVFPLGGILEVFADPGTYTVSVQYLANAGATVSVKERKLRVLTVGH